VRNDLYSLEHEMGREREKERFLPGGIFSASHSPSGENFQIADTQIPVKNILLATKI